MKTKLTTREKRLVSRAKKSAVEAFKEEHCVAVYSNDRCLMRATLLAAELRNAIAGRPADPRETAVVFDGFAPKPEPTRIEVTTENLRRHAGPMAAKWVISLEANNKEAAQQAIAEVGRCLMGNGGEVCMKPAAYLFSVDRKR